MKINVEAKINIDELFEACELENGEDLNRVICDCFGDFHRSFVAMDNELKERELKSGKDEDYDEELFDKYSDEEVKAFDKIIKKIKRYMKSCK